MFIVGWSVLLYCDAYSYDIPRHSIYHPKLLSYRYFKFILSNILRVGLNLVDCPLPLSLE